MVIIRDFEPPGLQITVERDDEGRWELMFLNKLPEWVNEVAADIYNVIE